MACDGGGTELAGGGVAMLCGGGALNMSALREAALPFAPEATEGGCWGHLCPPGA